MLISRLFDKENSALMDNFEELQLTYDELKKSLDIEKISFANLTVSHKDIGTKLLKAVRLLIDEKVTCKIITTKLQQSTEEVTNLQNQNVSDLNVVELLNDDFVGYIAEETTRTSGSNNKIRANQ